MFSTGWYGKPEPESVEAMVLESFVNGAGGVTFTCKHCGEVKPFEEMVVVTEYTPAIIVCKACAKAIRK